ncbi:MAG: hypothetical protein V9E82_00515 [Candidatus Nanopelagicales bacterium]
MIRRLTIPLTAAMITASATPALAEEFTVKLAHGPITATLNPVTPGTASPGDMRLFYIDLTRPGKQKVVGFLTGSLLTTAVARPVPGKEYRAADLIFTVGDSQLVLGGVAVYDQNAPTVSKRSSVIRPVIGGTGMYAGAHGWAKSTRFKDNTWRHTFHVDVDK